LFFPSMGTPVSIRHVRRPMQDFEPGRLPDIA
jgi:hypothetical protein